MDVQHQPHSPLVFVRAMDIYVQTGVELCQVFRRPVVLLEEPIYILGILPVISEGHVELALRHRVRPEQHLTALGLVEH